MLVKPIKIRVEPQVITDFEKLARKAFPKETLAYLLGVRKGNRIAIMDLWTPEDVGDYCTDSNVITPKHWDAEAHEHAEEEGWNVIGDIHSHPYTYTELENRRKRLKGKPEMEELNWPSSQDWYGRCGHLWITGVCLVKEDKLKRLSTNIMLFGPLLALEEL